MLGSGGVTGLVTGQCPKVQAISFSKLRWSIHIKQAYSKTVLLVLHPSVSRSRSRIELSLEVAMGKATNRMGTADRGLTFCHSSLEGERKTRRGN